MNLPFWRKKCKKGIILALFKLLKIKTVNRGCVKELFRGGWLLYSSSSKVTYTCGVLQNVLNSTAAAQLCVGDVKGYWMILEKSQCKYKEGVWARARYLADQTGAAVLESVRNSNDTSARAKFVQILKFPKPTKQNANSGAQWQESP